MGQRAVRNETRNKGSKRATRQEVEKMTDTGDATAPFFGFIGAAAALVFSSMGAAYGTAEAGARHEVHRPRRHGGCPWYLRFHHLRAHRAESCPNGLQDVRRVRPPGLGLVLRLERS